MKAQENVDQQQKDSDMIFTQITSGSFSNYTEAELALVTLYVPDTSISRSGISHAMVRLKAHFDKGD